MSAFDVAWAILKRYDPDDDYEPVTCSECGRPGVNQTGICKKCAMIRDKEMYVEKAEPGPVWLERARQYILDNQNNPHPKVQQSVEELYQWLTNYSSKVLAGGPNPGPMPKVYDMHEIMDFNEGAESPSVHQRTGDPRIERMRTYVNEHINNPIHELRQSAMNVERYLTDMMSGRDPGPMPKMYDMHEVMRLMQQNRQPSPTRVNPYVSSSVPYQTDDDDDFSAAPVPFAKGYVLISRRLGY